MLERLVHGGDCALDFGELGRLLRLFPHLLARPTPAGAAMEYKGFIVRAFEQENGEWRATIRRPHGRPLKARDRRKLYSFVTPRDADTATDAVLYALYAIDAGSFSRNTARSTERFWRRNRQRSASSASSHST
jgi:hypothetical protein